MTSSLLRIVPLLALPLTVVTAQHLASAKANSRDSLSVMATALVTTVSPALGGRAHTEAQVTQPMLAVRGARGDGALQYSAMLNAERWTMPDGEPVAGIWGEGFVERRHPHTVVHEVMLSGTLHHRALRMSVAGGRGFVPFGTDDPMVRPFTTYPANHHLSQVMERVQIVAAAAVGGRAAIEVASFNGDEPSSPTSAPQWNRFGDSFAARATLWPHNWLELQGSAAAVRSPEFIRPDGLDQRKFSASARFTPHRRTLEYALVEWARTDERYQGRHIVTYGTGLAEMLIRRHAWSAALRVERTSRPEDERLLDPFRTARPPNHLLIQGMTRWHILSAQLARSVQSGDRVHSTLFAEVEFAQSTPLISPVLLNPRDVIGADHAAFLIAGIRIGAGAMSTRVGRYGASASAAGTSVDLNMSHEH